MFSKYRFPAIFGGHLEFLCKMQKRVYLRNGERQILTKFFTPRVYTESCTTVFQNIVFTPYLAATRISCKMQKHGNGAR